MRGVRVAEQYRLSRLTRFRLFEQCLERARRPGKRVRFDPSRHWLS